MQWLEGVVIFTGAVLAWGLGLFVLSRGGLRRIPLLTAAATLTLVVYQVGQALGALAPDTATWLDWSRRTWWAASLAPGLWLVLVLILAVEEAPETARPAWMRLVWSGAPVAILAGVAFAVIGASTDIVQDWASPSAPRGPLHVPPGPAFGVYQAYVVVCLAGAAIIVGFLWWTSEPGGPLRARFGWLLVSAAAFLLSGLYVTTFSGLFGFSVLPAQVLLSAGLVILGWNLARYGALLAGETVLADLLAFSLATATMLALYGGLLLVLSPRDYPWLERLLPLLLLLMATHVAADRQNVALDRLVFGQQATGLRARLRDLADRAVRQPDPLTALAEVRQSVADLARQESVPDLRLLVEGALRHANDLPALSGHPLLDTLVPPTHGTALERARQLRAELEAAIGRLRPPGARPAPGGSAGPGGWVHYLVLHEAYVEGRPNKQIMARYLLSESTFHRARRRAIDAVAEDFSERLEVERTRAKSV
jgi:hypothetical protein